MWEQFLRPLKFTAREIDILVDLSEGFSGSDIQEVSVRLHRRRITTKYAPRLHEAFLIVQDLAIGEGKAGGSFPDLKERIFQQSLLLFTSAIALFIASLPLVICWAYQNPQLSDG
jgi:hypothetical protein